MNQLTLFSGSTVELKPRRAPVDTSQLFAQAVGIEDTNPEQASALYQRIIDNDGERADAFINLGTLHYNAKRLAQAEDCYRRAVAADSKYALAHFDLGNVLDERGKTAEAIEAYKQALALAPRYADAHYNLALCYELRKQSGRALRHWRAYLKLDSGSPWGAHAAAQSQRTVKASGLAIVYRKQ